jgi:two-component system, OmpR family, osmolarity sensor histidine kinase EnvZ
MKALLRRIDSLMLRLMVAQVFVIAVIFATMIFAIAQYRGAATARMIAPLWAEAIKADGEPDARPAFRRPAKEIRLLRGPPPANARNASAFRYDALQAELLSQGVKVDQIRVSGPARQSVTWLHVQKKERSDWLGLPGGMPGLNTGGFDDGLPRAAIVVIALVLVIISSWWISRTVVRPVKQLEEGMRRFFHNADEMPTLSEQGPAEIRALSKSFLKVAGERAKLDHERALMLTGISHDLRSPLARIRVAADLISNNSADAALRESIQRNVDIADHHLESFMAFAMPPTLADRKRIDVRALFDEVVQSTVPDTSQVLIQVESNAQYFLSNATLLERVLISALDNAVKHGALPIDVRAFRMNGSMVLEVEDSGVGLAPSERERVLRPFERGQQARTKPGTGLGLSIASQIAHRLDGHVELTQRARGLVFRCVLRANHAA